MEKVAIRIEVNNEDYETIISFKRLLGLTWGDLLYGGFLYWWNIIGEEQGFLKLLQEKKEISENVIEELRKKIQIKKP